MKGLFKLLLLIILVLIFIAGIAGFVPGLSTVLGTDKPKDFGIAITIEDTLNAQAKSGVILEGLPSDTPIENSYQLSGKKEASFSFDSKEATAIINNRPWKYYPFSNLQLRINSDGTIETSGMVNTGMLVGYIQSFGYSVDDINQAMRDYKIPKVNAPFYIKGKGMIVDNKVDINVQSLEVGRVPVPTSILAANMFRINSFVQDVVGRQNGFTAKKLVVEDGKIVFDGTLPEKESVVYK